MGTSLFLLTLIAMKERCPHFEWPHTHVRGGGGQGEWWFLALQVVWYIYYFHLLVRNTSMRHKVSKLDKSASSKKNGNVSFQFAVFTCKYKQLFRWPWWSSSPIVGTSCTGVPAPSPWLWRSSGEKNKTTKITKRYGVPESRACCLIYSGRTAW